MKALITFSLAACWLLLTGCAETVHTIVWQNGKTTMTEHRGDKTLGTWELKEVASPTEVSALRREGWKREGILHHDGAPDTYLMKRPFKSPETSSSPASATNGICTFVWLINTNIFDGNFEKEVHLNLRIKVAEEQHRRDVHMGSYNNTWVVDEALRDYLAQSSVKIDPPNFCFYNDRRGEILFRGTPRECRIAKNALEHLNRGLLIVVQAKVAHENN